MTDINRYLVTRYTDLQLRVIKQSPFANYVSQTYGMIVYAVNTQRWLLIQRRHSIGLLSILKGNFALSNLPNLFKTMNQEEVAMLTSAITSKAKFVTLAKNTCENVNPKYLDFTWLRVEFGRDLIVKLLDKHRDTPVQLEWLWPKGFKRNSCYKEESLDTAMREFKEESGIRELKSPYTISYETINYEQGGVMGQTYYTKCWVLVMKEEQELSSPLSSEIEVADRRWFTTDQVKDHLDQSLLVHFQRAQKMVENVISICA